MTRAQRAAARRLVARRRRAEAAEGREDNPKKSQLKTAVHVAASLERPQDFDKSGYSYTLQKLYVDKKGNLCAEAQCGDDVFVCTKAEIPAFSEFLASLSTELTRANG